MDFQKLDAFIDSLDMKSIEYVKQRIQIQETITFCHNKKLKMLSKKIVKKHEILRTSIENMKVTENEYTRVDYHVYWSRTFKIGGQTFSISFNGTNEGYGVLNIFWNENCILECGTYDFEYKDLDTEVFDEEFYQSEFKEINKKDFIEFLRELSC